MFTAYLAVTVVLAAYLAFSAGADFVRWNKVLVVMARAGVPESWLTPLGGVKAAGAVGLLVGIAVHPIGIAAACGVILFFVGAIITHIRARFYSFGSPSSFLLMAVAALVLRLASL
jgi:DoxX-like family